MFVMGGFFDDNLESPFDCDGEISPYGGFVSFLPSDFLEPFRLRLLKLSTSIRDSHWTNVSDIWFTCIYFDTRMMSDAIFVITYLIIRSVYFRSRQIFSR